MAQNVLAAPRVLGPVAFSGNLAIPKHDCSNLEQHAPLTYPFTSITLLSILPTMNLFTVSPCPSPLPSCCQGCFLSGCKTVLLIALSVSLQTGTPQKAAPAVSYIWLFKTYFVQSTAAQHGRDDTSTFCLPHLRLHQYLVAVWPVPSPSSCLSSTETAPENNRGITILAATLFFDISLPGPHNSYDLTNSRVEVVETSRHSRPSRKNQSRLSLKLLVSDLGVSANRVSRASR